MSNVGDFIIENGIVKEYTGTDAEVVIPEGVIEIGVGAFRNYEKLESITFPLSIEVIGRSAFESCYMLKNIEIPASIKTIESSAFAACRSLEKIYIPSSIKEISMGMFSGCINLTDVSLTDGLQDIGKFAFGGCKRLTNIEIPDSVISVGDRAFSGCVALGAIRLSKGLNNIEKDAFTNCAEDLNIYCSAKAFTSLSKETKDNITRQWLFGRVEYEAEQTEAIRKYAGRTMDRLFAGIGKDDDEFLARLLTCGKIKPEALDTYIKRCNDGKHPRMMSVLLNYQEKNVSPEKREELSDKALGITELTQKDWAEIYRWTQEKHGITITKYKSIDATVEIPSHIDGVSVVKIGKNAFKGNDQITTVRIPDTIIEIGESAFEKCSALVSVEWGSELRTIEKRAFYLCEAMEGALVLPKNLKHIGVNAFSGCPFTELQLPEGIETIASGALDSCDIAEYHIPASAKELGLFCGYFEGDVYIYGKDTKIEKNEFREMPTTLHAPVGSYTEEHAKRLEIPFVSM